MSKSTPTTGPDLQLIAMAALVDADGRVLLARRPEGKSMAGLWEFPGGKLQPGESPETALARELREEIGVRTAASCLAPLCFASHRTATEQLLLLLYACRTWDGRAVGREGQELAWARPHRMRDFAMPPANASLVAMLRDWI